MTRQLRLEFRRQVSFAPADFVCGPSNARAFTAIESWPDWHAGCLALVGPEASGKTHLGRIWADRANAVTLDRLSPNLSSAQGRPVLLEDVDRGVDEEALFHLINMAGHSGGGLLLTARTPPIAWPATLPDLRSRLNAMRVEEIAEPDDTVLEGVLRKFFKERGIRPAPDLYPYLLRRMERSVSAAWDLATILDEAADAQQKPITRMLARQVLDGGMDNLDLFDP